MPERKSKAQRMAEEAFVIGLAEKKVIDEETKYVKDLTAQLNALMYERPVEAEEIVDEIFREKERVNPDGKWDEEEVIVYQLNRKKPK